MADTEAASAPAAETPAADAPSQVLTVDRAREVMQQAYARSRGDGAPSSMATALDNAADGGGQSDPTPAPSEPAPAPSRERPARSTARSAAPDQRAEEATTDQPAADEAQAAEAEPPSPPSDADASDEGEAPTGPTTARGRNKAAAILEQEEFQSEAWQRAFQARPDLRRTVPGIVLNANLSSAQQATQLHAKMQEGLQEAQAQTERQENLRALREVNPPAYVDYLKQQEAEQAQFDLLTRQATLVMAAATGADPDDPAFLEAGPKEGENFEVGLERLGDFFVTKGERVRQHLDSQRAEWEQAKAREITALKAQFETDKQAAVEQALGQARSPFGRFQPPPRATGNGVVPVGEGEEGSGRPGGSPIDLKNPTAAIRGAIDEGYRRRGART
jgi:hypothetical protein